MRFWRIASNVPGEYAADDLRGEGARKHGGRWNSPGVPAVYASLTVATAVLETLAHIGMRRQPTNRYLVAIDIADKYLSSPDAKIVTYNANDLPIHWNAQPVHQVSQLWGDQRLFSVARAPRGNPLPPMGFVVPSVLVEEECNIVLNPRHPWVKRYARAKVIRPFVFDRRLVTDD